MIFIYNIPLQETINICVDNLYNDNENPPNIPKHDLHDWLNIATKETFFIFNSKYYKQVDGVAMGSLLGPALANIFMCSFESKWLRDCPNDFKPVFYRCYIDDIFVLFSSPDHAYNSFFREYNLYFKNTLSPFKVVYYPVSCLLHLLTHVITKRVPIVKNFKRPIYQTFN